MKKIKLFILNLFFKKEIDDIRFEEYVNGYYAANHDRKQSASHQQTPIKREQCVQDTNKTVS